MKLSFNLDASGISGNTPVTQSRVGVMPLSNQSIQANVSSDFFGSPVATTNTMAGPFAAAHNGANSFTLWPPAGQTVPTPPAPPSGTPVNLATGANAKATASYQDGTYLASNAIDGNGATRWSSDHSGDNNAWLQVDLGAEYAVSTAVLNWEAAYGKAYKIQVSDDGSHWADAYSTTTGAGGTETVGVNKNARYVRMQGVTPATQYGYSLYEFEVYGTAVGGSGTGGATVYGDANYSGPSATFAAGSYDLPALQAKGIANDSISSIRVPAGYTVTGYADAGFAGTAWTFTSDAADLTASGNNDKISSLRVTSGS
jgi:hypothetical protein